MIVPFILLAQHRRHFVVVVVVGVGVVVVVVFGISVYLYIMISINTVVSVLISLVSSFSVVSVSGICSLDIYLSFDLCLCSQCVYRSVDSTRKSILP